MGERTEELRREIASTRGDLGNTLDAIGDRVSPGRIIERRKNRISGGFRSMSDKVMGRAHGASSTVSDAGHSAVETLQDAPDRARQSTQGAPVMAGVIAFAAGFVLAAVIPPTETEKEASSHLVDKVAPIKAELATVGHDVADHLKEPVSDAVDQVKTAAKEHASDVAASAKDAAHETADRAKESAGAVKDSVDDA
jgi:gas vesicle protein